jgi:integrase
MGHSEYDPAAKERPPWNAGRKLGVKRALKPQQVWAILFWLDHERRLRDRALFDLAIDSKLRGCDVVKVRIGDTVSGGRIRIRAIVVQQKTGRPVQFELLEAARTSILGWLVRIPVILNAHWLEQRGGTLDDYAFPSRIDHTTHLSTRQYARLVDEWVTGIGLRQEDYGTHSLRRTKGVDHLYNNRQSAGCPDPARPHQDREHGPLSRRRRRGRAPPGGKHRRVEAEPA